MKVQGTWVKISAGVTVLLAMGAWGVPVAQAGFLTSKSFVISSGAGQSGAGTQTSDMIMSDGSSWSGGAVGVQGPASFSPFVIPSNHPLASSVSFKYNVGAVTDSLNTQYGVGNWTITNAQLTFQYTLYANNSRFGGGAGNFEIYWVGNDNWTQGSNNPVFATTGAELAGWAGSQALLNAAYFSWSTETVTGTTSETSWFTDKSGSKQATISYGLGAETSFVEDILGASASSNPNVSLYLLASSPTTGITIFTGGGSVLPTLSFDVVTNDVPEPASLWLLGVGVWVAKGRRK